MEKITTRRLSLSLSFYHLHYIHTFIHTSSTHPHNSNPNPNYPLSPLYFPPTHSLSSLSFSLLLLLFSLYSFAAVLFSLPFFAWQGSSSPFTPTSACRIFFRQQGISNLLLPVVLAIPFNS